MNNAHFSFDMLYAGLSEGKFIPEGKTEEFAYSKVLLSNGIAVAKFKYKGNGTIKALVETLALAEGTPVTAVAQLSVTPKGDAIVVITDLRLRTEGVKSK